MDKETKCTICYKGFGDDCCEDYLQGCHEVCFSKFVSNPKKLIHGHYHVELLDDVLNDGIIFDF